LRDSSSPSCFPLRLNLPTRGTFVPSRSDWLHEVKYDGFRLIVHRNGDHVRLTTRGGHDWAKRYPWIIEAVLKNRHKQFVLDGEAVVLGADGISDFNALHSGKHNREVQLSAFDVLAMDGSDLRQLPLLERKAKLDKLLARRSGGIFVGSLEQGEIGPDLFRHACVFGVEASRSALSRAVEGLGQGEEPRASRDAAGYGGVQMKFAQVLETRTIV
jgi:bifunctional non-homologous end joining protein LigD